MSIVKGLAAGSGKRRGMLTVALASVVALLGSVPLAANAAAQSKGSLWGKPGSSTRGTIADQSALEVGDLVTVVVSEGQTVQDDGKLETTKSSDLDTKLQVFDLKPNAFDTLPALKYSSERSVNGESKYEQKGKFETRLSAVVLDVKPNGNLLIEGRRVIHLDGDLKEIRVRGLVRPVDISAENIVESERIADADIVYDAEGTRSDTVEKGWFAELMDYLWPF